MEAGPVGLRGVLVHLLVGQEPIQGQDHVQIQNLATEELTALVTQQNYQRVTPIVVQVSIQAPYRTVSHPSDNKIYFWSCLGFRWLGLLTQAYVQMS